MALVSLLTVDDGLPRDVQTKRRTPETDGFRGLSCEEEDSNLHGSYPASTSSGFSAAPECDFGTLGSVPKPTGASESSLIGRASQLAAEAASLLQAAALQEPVSRERAAHFARAALSADEIGRAALAVLDGGPHSARALVRLAALVGRAHAVEKPTHKKGTTGD